MKLEGKTCLITGANSGLGFATAKRFAAEGANVILVCRDKEKLESTKQAIFKQTPSAMLGGVAADLSNLNSVKLLVDEVKRNYTSLDILFNNAAVMKMERSITPDGFETMFQTNYLTPFLLSTELSELMKKKAPSQIINMAVPSPKQRVNFNDLQFEQKFNSFNAFFQTKLYLLLFSLELSDRLMESGVNVNCLEPGAFRSNLSREAPGIIQWLAGLFSNTADDASKFVKILAENTDQPGMTGKVFSRDKAKTITEYWQDRTIREKLWNETVSLVSRKNNN